GEMHQPGGEDSESRLLDLGDDAAHHTLLNGVGLDDREGALERHRLSSLPGEVVQRARPSTRPTVAPMSAGLLTVVMPAASIARIFSAAVPLPPQMIPPAGPLPRPRRGGLPPV